MKTILLPDVYHALRNTLAHEDAKTIADYLQGLRSSRTPTEATAQFIGSENALPRTEFEKLPTTLHAECEQVRAAIRKAKRSTFWAMIIGMIPAWGALLYLLYKM